MSPLSRGRQAKSVALSSVSHNALPYRHPLTGLYQGTRLGCTPSLCSPFSKLLDGL